MVYSELLGSRDKADDHRLSTKTVRSWRSTKKRRPPEHAGFRKAGSEPAILLSACRGSVSTRVDNAADYYQLPTSLYFILPISLCVMRLYTYILTALSPSASAV